MPSKKNIGLGAAGIIVVGAIGIIALFPSPTTTPSSSTNLEDISNSSSSISSTSTKTTTSPGPKQYTMTDVSSHNSAQSCWTTISGKVYDLTTWINQHPGGREAILSICGIDGTRVFLNQHSGQKEPAQELARLLIGNLAP